MEASYCKPKLLIKQLNEKSMVPKKATEFAAGYDLFSIENITVPARGKACIGTGISMSIPLGNYGRIAPRSGLAAKNMIDVGAGVIDSDYRGEVKVLLFNHSAEDFEVKYGDRIAQLIIEKYTMTDIEVVSELEATVRGDGGFGSTGVALKGDKENVPQNNGVYQEASSSKKRKIDQIN